MSVIEPLTEHEKEHARIVWRLLSDRWGREKAITSTQIIKQVADVTNGDVLLTGPRVRKIIGFLRGEGHMSNLISGGAAMGYFRTSDRGEAYKYLRSLNDRVRAMEYTRNRMMKEFNISLDELGKGTIKLDLE